MLRRRVKGMDVSDIIFVIIFTRAACHGRTSSLPACGKQVSRSSRVLFKGFGRIFLISVFWFSERKNIQTILSEGQDVRLWHRSVTTVTVCCSACRCFSPSRHLIPKQLHKSHKKTAEKNFCGFMVARLVPQLNIF